MPVVGPEGGQVTDHPGQCACLLVAGPWVVFTGEELRARGAKESCPPGGGGNSSLALKRDLSLTG